MGQPYGEIVMAVYRPDFLLLEKQVSSIRAQSATEWNCHVGIDGHDSETLTLLNHLVDGDDRFILHDYKKNVGFYRNFERLLGELSPRAQWVALADQDDSWDVNKLSVLIQQLVGVTVAATCQARVVNYIGDSLGVTHRKQVAPKSQLLDNQVTGCLSVFRRDVVDLAMPFPPVTDSSYHDHWLGVVAMSLGEVKFMPDLLQDYVQHGNNALGEELDKSIRRRVGRLARQSGGLLRFANYVATHRWGWRVSMARILIQRISCNSDARANLEIVALGRLSVGLISMAAGSVWRAEADLSRVAMLLIGSAVHPWVEARDQRGHGRVKPEAV